MLYQRQLIYRSAFNGFKQDVLDRSQSEIPRQSASLVATLPDVRAYWLKPECGGDRAGCIAAELISIFCKRLPIVRARLHG